MNHLHAYWRIEYIQSSEEEKSNNENLFTRLPKMKDEDALIVERRTHSYLVLNKYPYNPGHLMAVPYRCVKDLNDLSADERLDLIDSMSRAQYILKQALNPDGFNMGFNFGRVAGAGILTHLHAHIVPRWNGDTNFMPVLGETRVLPESLKSMWQRLREFI